MAKELLHNCPRTSTGEIIDCTTCKLASLTEKKKKECQKKRIDEDDDYSISEQLTGNKGDYSILTLAIIAAFTFALVVLFTKLLA